MTNKEKYIEVFGFPPDRNSCIAALCCDDCPAQASDGGMMSMRSQLNIIFKGEK